MKREKSNEEYVSFFDQIEGAEKKEEMPEVEEKERKSYIKLHIGYYPRLFIYIILIISFLTAAIYFMRDSFSIVGEEKLDYKLTGQTDYRVYLKENDFYTQDYFDSKDQIVPVAKYISRIDIFYNCLFDVNKDVDALLNYKIIAKVKAYDDTGSKVYLEEEEVLVPDKVTEVNKSKTAKIEENVSIDFDKYNEIANNFKLSSGLSAKTELEVYLAIGGNIEKYNTDMSGKKLVVTIPLSKKDVDIKLSQNSIDAEQQIIKESNIEFNKKSNLIIAIICVAFAIDFVYKLIKFIIGTTAKVSKYDKFIKKTLLEYDRLIVETDYLPEFSDYKLIKIASFNELLDVRDNIKKPIMYIEVRQHEKAYFYILEDNVIYLFVLKAVDLNKKEN